MTNLSTGDADSATRAGMNTKPAERWMAIDVLRGLIMVLMAIDHVRDFFSNAASIRRTSP